MLEACTCIPAGCKHEQRHSSKTTKVETWITARKAFCKHQAINKPLAQRTIAHKNARQKNILLAKLGQVKHWSRHTLRKSQECNARSGGHWFTEFCNSQRLSRFAAPFTGARAKISIAESCGSWNNALPTVVPEPRYPLLKVVEVGTMPFPHSCH